MSKSLICLLLILASVRATVPSDVIQWGNVYPLQWTDYKAQVPHQAEHGAVTAYEVRSTNKFLDWQHVTYEVTRVMIKNRSWVKPEFRSDSALLGHERLHFDLAECSARALRSRLHMERTSVKECNQRLEELRDSTHGSWLSIEARYDLETAHGTVAKEQARWARKIAHTLDSLAAYNETRFVVELKR
jgi:hypothetical protein